MCVQDFNAQGGICAAQRLLNLPLQEREQESNDLTSGSIDFLPHFPALFIFIFFFKLLLQEDIVISHFHPIRPLNPLINNNQNGKKMFHRIRVSFFGNRNSTSSIPHIVTPTGNNYARKEGSSLLDIKRLTVGAVRACCRCRSRLVPKSLLPLQLNKFRHTKNFFFFFFPPYI